jgi:hypothetical protein
VAGRGGRSQLDDSLILLGDVDDSLILLADVDDSLILLADVIVAESCGQIKWPNLIMWPNLVAKLDGRI